MKLRQLIACLLFTTLTVVLHGQEICMPKPLPYLEDFNIGFSHDNGYWGAYYDITRQEEVNCWTVCWLHSWGWRSFVIMVGPENRTVMMLRTTNYYTLGNISHYMYAVTPQTVAAPRRLQFNVCYEARDWNINTPISLPDGAMLALGYVTDENDCINSYVPFDTIRVFANWTIYDDTVQEVDIDLRRSFVTFPQPWRIAFRAERNDETDDVIFYIDDIRISDEVPEYHCTEEYADTVCIGTGYHHHGFHIPPEQTNTLGTRHYNYVDTTGCLVSLDLTVRGTHTTELVDTVPCGQPSHYAPDTVLTSGTHYIHLTNRYGCDSLVVLTIHQAWVTHLYDTIQEGDTLLFEGQNLTAGGIYTHDTVATDGCDSLVVMHLSWLPLPPVNTDTLTFWFPNVFTPEQDDNNRFSCIANCEVTEFELYIYNRMGLLVHHTQDIHAPWDGTRNGQPLPQGTYAYHYRLRTPDNNVHSGAGTVTLLR